MIHLLLRDSRMATSNTHVSFVASSPTESLDVADPSKESEQTKLTLKSMYVHAIDVGQGDSILVKLKYYDKETDKTVSRSYLVDGGRGDKLLNVEECLRDQGRIRDESGKKNTLFLNGIVVTHPDEDHVQGVTALLKTHPLSRRVPIIATRALVKHWRVVFEIRLHD